MSRVATYAAKSRWLTRQNQYLSNIVTQLKKDLKARPSTVNHGHLADYIAASIPLHVSDGWTFLGRSLASHLRGDSGTSRHLAYYAELRASMALLAAQGIGIFSGDHFVIEAGGTVRQIPTANGTHVAAWEILEAWSSLPSAAALLGEILTPGGFAMVDWVKAMPKGGAWATVSGYLVTQLGIDLAHYTSDRNARNESSYRPNLLRGQRELPVQRALEFASSFWGLLEPGETGAFGRLDQHLLRLALERSFVATEGVRPTGSKPKFEAAIDQTIAVNIHGAGRSTWRDFLVRTSEGSDPDVIHLATSAGLLDDVGQHTRIISRAMLLLRIATGAARKCLTDAALSFDDISFWWGPYGTDRGLWTTPLNPQDLTDKWADAEAGMAEIVERSPGSYQDFLKYCGVANAYLPGMEIVGLWGLAS